MLFIQFVCIFQGYLLVGYYINATDGYDVKWTTPHCVLVLRLIGVVFDVLDGRSKPVSSIQESKVREKPKILEKNLHQNFLDLNLPIKIPFDWEFRSSSDLLHIDLITVTRGGFSLVWFSLVFDWALFRTINVDQCGGKTESERYQRLLAMMICTGYVEQR